MNRLIKNELTKIFHKKALYIVLIITLGFMILSCILNKVFENNTDKYIDQDIAFYEEQLEIIDKNNPEDKEWYEDAKLELQILKLKKQYGTDSWQTYIIENKGRDILNNMSNSQGTTQYDELLARLEKGDWKSFAREELDEINEQIASMEQSSQDTKYLEYSKQVLEWRLEKGIPYGVSNMNTFLDTWLSSKRQIDDYEQSAKTSNKTYEEKYRYQGNVALVNMCEYAIVNNIDSNIYLNESYAGETSNLATSADTDLLNVFDNYSIFIIVAIVIIAGTIISEEFNKGTIKLLLVRPYKRTKILMAKFISCLIILAIVFVAVTLMQFIMGGISNGFGDYNRNVIIYNFDTNSVQTIGLISYLLLTAISKLPMYILMMTLAFTLSTIFTNSPIAIALPLLGMMGADIINQLAYSFEKAKFLMYFVTPNWDLSIFLFGKMPQFEPISLSFSIVICAIYFIIMVVTSTIVFKKRNIKNI